MSTVIWRDSCMLKQKIPLKKILGLDPGLETIGWGQITVEGEKYTCEAYDVIKTKNKDETGQRLSNIYKELQGIIEDFQPDIVSIEDLFFARNVTSGMKVAQARGVILLVCYEYKEKHNLEDFIEEYTPLQIKKTLTNYGWAKKKDVQDKVQELLQLPERPKQDDAADALGVALTCAIVRHNNQKEQTPLKVKADLKQ